MTDYRFRKLCEELLDELQYQTDWSVAEDLKDRAYAALAEPELKRLTPQPISVHEPGPGPEDCEAWERSTPISNMWCWWWDSNEDAWVRGEADTYRPSYLTHWLPAHALPLPS